MNYSIGTMVETFGRFSIGSLSAIFLTSLFKSMALVSGSLSFFDKATYIFMLVLVIIWMITPGIFYLNEVYIVEKLAKKVVKK